MTTPAIPLTGANHNLAGIVMMSVSMALFAFEDAMIKLGAVDLPTGQIVMTNALFGMLLFGGLSVLRRENPVERKV